MAHEVRIDTNINQILNKDVTLTVKTGANGNLKKLGTLLISKGNVEWTPAGNYVNKYRISWTDLADLIVEKGKQVQAK